MFTFKNYTIADWLSFYRIAAVPILLVLLWFREREIFTWFLLISYSTDAIDGYLARKLKISSERGAQFDSIGDQLTFILSLIGLCVFEKAFIKEKLLLIAIAFVPYIVQMLIAFKKYGKATAFHTYLAKISAVTQAFFILSTLFFYPVYQLFYVILVIGVLETLEEIKLIFMYDNWVKDVKGIYWVVNDKQRVNVNENK